MIVYYAHDGSYVKKEFIYRLENMPWALLEHHKLGLTTIPEIQ